MSNIVQIDINKIDEEIDVMQNRIKYLTDLKNTIANYSVLVGIVKPKNGKAAKSNTGERKGISEFIVDMLNETGGSDTKDIINAYADYMKTPADKVSNGVYNALSRMKTVTKVLDNQKIPGGRSAGSMWFVLKK